MMVMSFMLRVLNKAVNLDSSLSNDCVLGGWSSKLKS